MNYWNSFLTITQIKMYQTIVYIHVLSAFVMFSLWVSELIVFLANRVGDDSIKRVKRYLGFSQVTSMIIVLATGFYLMHYRGGPQAWLVVSVVLLLSTIPASIAFLRSAKRSKSMYNRLRFLFVNSMYKISTALVILTLMVAKHTEYAAIVMETGIIYLIAFAIPAFVYFNRIHTDGISQ